jgi:hypothetical protein
MAALHFEVVGWLWSGVRAAYQYTDATAPDEPCSAVEARAIRDALIEGKATGASVPHMGDFAGIDDCRIVHVREHYERAGTLLRRIDEARTLAGWRYGSSGGFYRRVTSGR